MWAPSLCNARSIHTEPGRGGRPGTDRSSCGQNEECSVFKGLADTPEVCFHSLIQERRGHYRSTQTSGWTCRWDLITEINMLNESAVHKRPRRFLPQTAWGSARCSIKTWWLSPLTSACSTRTCAQGAHTTVAFDDNKGIAAFPLWRKKMRVSSADFSLQSFSTCQSILSHSRHAGLHTNAADFVVLYMISIQTWWILVRS